MRQCFTPRTQINGGSPRSRSRGRTLALGGACLLSAVALNFSQNANAVSPATTTFAVNSSIEATCIVSAAALDFGVYAFAVNDVAGSVSVTCTNTTGYSIGLDVGTSVGATVTNRGMTGPSGQILLYQLFSDAAHTVNFPLTAGVSGVGTGVLIATPIYGRETAGQYLTPGAYTDTITATVTY